MSSTCYELLSNVNWLEWAKTIFDLLKGIAWPFSLLILVSMFAKEIRERIKDIVSVGPTGAVLQTSSQSVRMKPSTGLTKPATHALATVQALISTIETQLSEIPEDEQIPKLISALAEAQTERNYEFVWGNIFGSQITALRRLKEAGSVSVEDAKRYYEEEVKKVHIALDDWPFEQWCEFLFVQQLVIKVESNRLALTDFGRDFLTFVDLRKQDLSRGL